MQEPEKYDFTEKERAFFAAHLDEINKRVSAINAAVGLVAAQNGLEGQWLIRPDGSGLTKADQCST